MTVLASHPLADLFPLISGKEFDDLVASIRASGLREPIVLYEDKILDGRNRYRACEAAGVAPILEPFSGTDPIRFVIDKNIHRRHLNESQRALIAAQLVTMKRGDNQHTKEVTKKPATTIAEAAELLRVSRDTVSLARKVLEEGSSEEIARVKSGSAKVTSIGNSLRAKEPAKRRRHLLADKVMARGRNPDRISNMRIRAEIWGSLREALTHLAALPLPSEVASIVRGQDKGGLIDRRLEKSIKWLEDFAHAWRNRDQAAAE